MNTTLAAQQDTLRRALAVLEVGPVWDPDVPEGIREYVDRSRPEMLRMALEDHEHPDFGDCRDDCGLVRTARRILALAGRKHEIVALRKVVQGAAENYPHCHIDDVLADRIVAAILVAQAAR